MGGSPNTSLQHLSGERGAVLVSQLEPECSLESVTYLLHVTPDDCRCRRTEVNISGCTKLHTHITQTFTSSGNECKCHHIGTTLKANISRGIVHELVTRNKLSTRIPGQQHCDSCRKRAAPTPNGLIGQSFATRQPGRG